MGETAEPTDPKGDASAADQIQGCVYVTYPIDPERIQLTRAALARSFTLKEEATQANAFFQDAPTETWKVSPERRRVELVEKFLEEEKNTPKSKYIQGQLNGIAASIKDGELLPFTQLTIRLDYPFSQNQSDPNRLENLTTITQLLGDFVSWLLKDADIGWGEVAVFTEEQWPLNRLGKLRDQIQTLQKLPSDVLHSRVEELALALERPPGTMPGQHGFSHFLIARNIHARIAPLTTSLHRGPGWLVQTIRTDDEPTPQEPAALFYMDPLRESRVRGYVRARPSGFPLLLSLWSWLQSTDTRLKEGWEELIELEQPLEGFVLNPLNWGTWRRLHELTTRNRRYLHHLRALEAEYTPSLEASLSRYEGSPQQEVWVPPEFLFDTEPAERRARGVLHDLVSTVKDELRQTREDAEASWGLGMNQKEDYGTRLQRAFTIILLIFASVELIELVRLIKPYL